MSRTPLVLGVAAALFAADVPADGPRVVADIAPIHSLAARVMQGVGSPALIVPPEASPHEHSLRPSEASALQSAEIVFWMGGTLAPWLDGALESLANDARVVTLPELEGVRLLETRDSALFEAHGDEVERARGGHAPDGEHAHDERDGDDHHAETDLHARDEATSGHDEDERHDGHAHGAGALDPHAWLSPHNAKRWLDAMAAELARVDPTNAETYAANATAARSELDELEAGVAETLAPVRDLRFVVFHDAYQYFEDAFGLSATGAIALSDASDPSPARVERIQRRIRDEDIGCVLAEPQFNDALIATVTDGTRARTAVIDPIGVALEPGPSLYPALLRGMAESLNGCR